MYYNIVNALNLLALKAQFQVQRQDTYAYSN